MREEEIVRIKGSKEGIGRIRQPAT